MLSSFILSQARGTSSGAYGHLLDLQIEAAPWLSPFQRSLLLQFRFERNLSAACDDVA